MTFEHHLPSWALLLLAGVAVLLAYGAYARPLVPLTRARRGALVALRALTLLLLVVFLLRPIVLVPPASARDAVVPVLIDASRSMRLAEADGQRRIDEAVGLVRQDLWPALSREFQSEVLTFGEELAPASVAEGISADGRRSDLSGALRAVRERYRGRNIAGIVVISDGGTTDGRDAAAAVDPSGPPVYPVGVGTARGLRDREVLSVTAGEAALVDAVVDLTVSAVSHGFGADPLELRVMANGRSVDVRRVRPAADGSPIHEVFTVSPDPRTATLYSVEIHADSREVAPENNVRSVLVAPPGRRRRLLLVEGAPGFEHSFLKRAWAQDPGIEVDSVVRKGQNDQGRDTFFVQAAASRTAALASGYPATREALFAYDAVVFGNIEGDFFTRDQLEMTADFVADRGGGLLVLGARSFAQHGLVGTPLEEVLPVDLTDRRGGLAQAAAIIDRGGAERNKLLLTPEGAGHPLMRIGISSEETRRRWSALPPLPSTAPLGGPRPGALVLAAAAVTGGVMRPMVAVQRYGQGRSMIFAGEASWRWRMMMPSSDRSHELFWRQAARWLSTSAPDPVSVSPLDGAAPGDTVSLDVVVRDREFRPVRDASVGVRLTAPGGERRDLKPAPADAGAGRYTARVRVDQPGVYRVEADARRGNVPLGASQQWILVGGADLELADPRLNDDVLRRVAAASGGRYLAASEAGELPGLLRSTRAGAAQPEARDIWHNAWSFSTIVVLLGAEWMLRRRWGMR